MNYEQFVSGGYIWSVVDETLFLRGNTTAYQPSVHTGAAVKRVNAGYVFSSHGTRGGVVSVPLVLAFISLFGFAAKRAIENCKKQ